MNLQNQVCTLAQGKRLEALGVKNSLFSWFGDEAPRLKDFGADGAEFGPWLWVATTESINNQEADHRANVCCTEPIAPAFTVAELGVMLGPFAHYLQRSDRNDYWYISLDKYQQFKTEAEGRAATLIYRLEKGAITAAEVNHLLQNA